MIFHVISTMNGEENEGMRNVATHITRELEKNHTVIASSLHDLPKLPGRCRRADCTLLFARCVSKVYYVVRLCTAFSKKTCLFLVQKPDAGFTAKAARHGLKCSCFTACREDARELRLAEGYQVYDLQIGINTGKFRPVSRSVQGELKKKYGFDPAKPLVLHVGHCSVGRGLEDFLKIDPHRFQRMVVASGMFDSEEVRTALTAGGITLHSCYLPNVNEVYQMADAYFFPTRSDEYVISVPLSVMEALACGVPTLGYASFGKLLNVRSLPGGIRLIESAEEINDALEALVGQRGETSLLQNPVSWEGSARDVLNKIKEA